MFVVTGCLTLLASVAVLSIPRVRHLEAELPDAELKSEPELNAATALAATA
jgi:hypothetical protein